MTELIAYIIILQPSEVPWDSLNGKSTIKKSLG